MLAEKNLLFVNICRLDAVPYRLGRGSSAVYRPQRACPQPQRSSPQSTGFRPPKQHLGSMLHRETFGGQVIFPPVPLDSWSSRLAPRILAELSIRADRVQSSAEIPAATRRG